MIVSFMAQSEEENKDKKTEITLTQIITVILMGIVTAVCCVLLFAYFRSALKINALNSEINSLQEGMKDCNLKIDMTGNKVPIIPSRPVPEAKFIPGDKIMPENKMVDVPIYPRQAPSTMIEQLKSNAKTAEYYATHRVDPAVHYEPVANEQPTASLTLFTDQKTV